MSRRRYQEIPLNRDIGGRAGCTSGPELDHVRVIATGRVGSKIVDKVILDQRMIDLGEVETIGTDVVYVVALDRKIFNAAENSGACPIEELVVFNSNVA